MLGREELAVFRGLDLGILVMNTTTHFYMCSILTVKANLQERQASIITILISTAVTAKPKW